MAITVVIELGLLIYVLFRYKLQMTVVLAGFLLLFLALFQVAEYGICEQIGFSDTTWARFGFASITMLPILGLHLVYSIAGKSNRRLLAVGYLGTLAWILVFIFGDIMKGAICSGNYVIFDVTEPWEGYYYIFYDLTILIAMVQAIRFSRETKKDTVKNALHWLFLAYISFTVPAAIIWFLTDGADMALPSIMCGFAVIFAVLVATRTVPLVAKKR